MVDGARAPGERVLVYDCDGYYMAASLAEKLARDGCTVRLVTFRDTIAPYMHFTLESHRMLRLLRTLGVELVTHHWVSEITERAVLGHDAYASGEVLEWEADGVVLVTQRISEDHLFRELVEREEESARAGIERVFRIGDCVVPRILAEAIFDGHRLGREIDSENPAVPLPYIRERRVLEASDADYDGILSGRGAGSFRPTSARAPDRATGTSGARFEPPA
jgi:dimethylamine/trimethylamine dehydrogenase